MEGCTTISWKFKVPGAARNWVLKEECTCQRDNQSARFAELGKWVTRNSNLCEAASNQIARKQTPNRVLHTTRIKRANHRFVITLDDNTQAPPRRTPRMAGNKDGQVLQVMNGGKLNKYHRRKNCKDVSPPQPVKQASVLKMPSGVDQSDKGITETPL